MKFIKQQNLSSFFIVFGIFILGTYSYFLWTLSSFPFLDLPNHLTRAKIMAELIFNPSSDSFFVDNFAFVFQFVPYLLFDLILAGFIQLGDVELGGSLITVLTFLSLPFATFILGKSFKLEKSCLIGFCLFGMLLSTNCFFLTGFFAYQLGVSAALITISSYKLLGDSLEDIKSSHQIKVQSFSQDLGKALQKALLNKYYFIFVALLIATYLLHLAGFFLVGFYLLSVILTSLFQARKDKDNFRLAILNFVLSILPVVLILLIKIVTGNTSPSSTAGFSAEISGSLGNMASSIHYSYGEKGYLIEKLKGALNPFYRVSLPLDLFIFGSGILLVLLLSIGKAPSLTCVQRFIKTELLFNPLSLLSILLLFAYLIFPREIGSIYDVDNRFILPLVIFVTLSFLSHKENVDGFMKQTVISSLTHFVLFGILLINLGYLYHYLGTDNARLEKIISSFKLIPSHVRVLPVATDLESARLQNTLHLSALINIKNQSLTPYLFSGSKGDSMSYFRERNFEKQLASDNLDINSLAKKSMTKNLWKRPNIFWYIRNEQVEGWDTLLESFDVIFLPKPYSEEKLPKEMLTLFQYRTEDESATILSKVDPSAIRINIIESQNPTLR